MIAFESPQFEDPQWVRPLLAAESRLACEYSFTNIHLWSRAYPQKIARLDDRLSGGFAARWRASGGPSRPATPTFCRRILPPGRWGHD